MNSKYFKLGVGPPVPNLFFSQIPINNGQIKGVVDKNFKSVDNFHGHIRTQQGRQSTTLETALYLPVGQFLKSYGCVLNFPKNQPLEILVFFRELDSS